MSARKPRTTLIAAVAVGSVVALLVLLLATRPNSSKRASSSALVGRPAPALGGNVVLGEPFDLGASDRWVVVNFFATWCVPCRIEHPELRAFSAEHRDAGDAKVVSVVYDQDPNVVRDWFRANGGDWTVLDSDKGRTAFEWGVTGVPESFVVSPTGIVVERIVGGVTKAGLDGVIKAFSRDGSEATTTSGAGR